MSDQTLTIASVGWFGKLPAAGDFIRREVPEGFLDEWDQWLQKGMVTAKELLGEQWHQTYLTFPVWNFLRGARGHTQPAMQWETPPPPASLWAGILVPSVDRVGRLFPLTLVFEIPNAVFLDIGIAGIEARLLEIETLTLKVLDDDDISFFEQALTGLAPLWSEPAAVPEGRGADNANRLDTCVDTPSDLVDLLGKQALLSKLSAEAMFWTRDGFPSDSLLLTREPLKANVFCQLLHPGQQHLLSD